MDKLLNQKIGLLMENILTIEHANASQKWDDWWEKIDKKWGNSSDTEDQTEAATIVKINGVSVSSWAKFLK